MSHFDSSAEEEVVPGASGCLVALVVIAIFGSYGLGIITGGYGQRYLDARKAAHEKPASVFPDPNPQPGDAPPAMTPEPPLEHPIVVEHAGLRVTLEMATARLAVSGAREVSLPGLLLMRLRVRNLSADRPVDVTSWMHSDLNAWLGQLTDDQNRAYESIHDADSRVGVYLASLPGYRPRFSLAPGEETTTWVAFNTNARPTGELRLSLSAVNYGQEGLLRFVLPPGSIAEGHSIR